MRKSVVTIQDCLDMASLKDMRVVLNDGRVVGFRKEESPRDTDQSNPRTSSNNNIRYAIYCMVAQGKRIVKESRKSETFIDFIRRDGIVHQQEPSADSRGLRYIPVGRDTGNC